VALHRPATEKAVRRPDATGPGSSGGTCAAASTDTFEQSLMPGEVVYTLHRAVVVRSTAPVTATKGVAGWAPDFGETLNARTEFVVSDASDDASKSSAQRLKDAVDERVERLQMEAAIKARVAELRHDAAVERRVEELRQQVDGPHEKP
jgi:hypothetical protein